MIITLSVAIVLITKLLNDWNARFFNALQNRDATAFWHEIRYWVVIVAIYIGIAVYRLWLRQLLAIRWRRSLSERYISMWMSDRTYYRMELAGAGADNPEQRIEYDCNLFTDRTLQLSLDLLSQFMTLVTFTIVLWNLSGTLILPLFNPISIPGYMMWAALAYAIAGSALTYFVGRPLVQTNFALERYNADFRYRMVRVRENAEAIALYHGEARERGGLACAFARVYDTWAAYMNFNKRLTALTAFYGQAAVIFPIIVAAPRYFAGIIPLGVLTQTAGAFGQVEGSLSWFVDSYAALAEWQAVVDRLTSFNEAMAQAKSTPKRAETFNIAKSAEAAIVLGDVTVRLPDGAPLLEHVSLTLARGEDTILTGRSGSGKSTLLRVLAGLWPYGDGRLGLPADARLLFLPQKPYLPVGTLKEVLCYPQPVDAVDEERCRDALSACLLAHLASCLDEIKNWSMILSGGEQQRLAFARALLCKPDWLFLDEATSALDLSTEQALLDLIKRRLPDTTIVSITHRQPNDSSARHRLAIDCATRSVTCKLLTRPNAG